MVKKLTKYSYLEPFLNTKDSLHLSEISKKIGEPHPTTRLYLNDFEKQGILKKKIKGRLSLYKLNYSNNFLIKYLIIAEEDKLLRRMSKDLILKELLESLLKITNNQKILIFGSATKNTKRANDIDLLVVGKLKIDKKLLEKQINKKIHLIQVSKLNEITSALKEEILKKHLLINGVEEILKWLH